MAITILLIVLIGGYAAWAVWRIRRDRKRRPPCNGGCANCPGSKYCSKK